MGYFLKGAQKLFTHVSHKASKGVNLLGKSSVVSQPLKKAKPLFEYSGKVDNLSNIVYEVKPGITIHVNPQTSHLTNPAFVIQGKEVASGNLLHKAELGNLSMRLSNRFESKNDYVKRSLSNIYSDYEKLSVRSKGANSVESKLERRIAKGKVIAKDSDALPLVLDGNGGRVYMKPLTKADVVQSIENAKYYGRKLTTSEKSIMQRYFNGEKLTKSELKVAKRYAHNIKLDLAEKHMEPKFCETMSSAIKDALDRNITTPEKLRKAGVREDLIQRAQSKNVTPATLVDVNNYSGNTGIPYYSNRQIKQFEALQRATGEDIEIISCPSYKRMSSKLVGTEAEAIKKGGFTRGQITQKLVDGTNVEVQFTVSDFAELDHLKYDISLGKNTLSPICYAYRDAYLSLSPAKKVQYDHYMKQYFNYIRDLELGIVSKKPELPKGFDEILSVESLEKIHHQLLKEQAVAAKSFIPGIRTVALKNVV